MQLNLDTDKKLCLVLADTNTLSQIKRLLTIEKYNPFAKIQKIVRYTFFYKDKYFPIGMVERVISGLNKIITLSDINIIGSRSDVFKTCINNLILHKKHFITTINEHNQTNYLNIKNIGSYELRPYQINAIHNAYWFKSGIMRIPTGGGKTLIACGIMKYIGKKKNLVIIHGKDLIEQTYEKYKEYLKNENIFIGKYTAEGYIEGNICISSVDTLYSRRNLLEKFISEFELILLDECHHSSSKNWMKVLIHSKTPLIFGMSGTPYRYNDVNDFCLESIAGGMIYDLPINQMQVLGHLSKAILFWIDTSDCQVDFKSFNSYDWASVKKHCIIENDKRTNKIVQVIKNLLDIKGGVLVLVGNSIEFGEIIQKKCIEEGILSVFISGKDSIAYRKTIFDKLRNNQLQIVISTTITDEGMDFPELGGIVLAYGGKSFVKLIQRIGRGLRPKEAPVVVIDFYDVDIHKFLTKHTYERAVIYQNEKIFDKIEFIS